ncbi:MAG: hypothetical protein C4K49_08785 [Candidatus Thorarchaeota archaeon]|nr:MAG: hypothetical protein C4K49_08785 [Candidatus Thorarchaeota archaeon]
MSYFAEFEARGHSRPTEILERVSTAVLNVFPEELRGRVKVETQMAEGYNRTTIAVISAVLRAKSPCETAVRHLLRELSSDDRRTLAATLMQRIDERCVLFVRIDKQAAYLGHLKLATGPDMISVKVHIQQYPRCTQETAASLIEGLLTEIGD